MIALTFIFANSTATKDEKYFSQKCVMIICMATIISSKEEQMTKNIEVSSV